MALGEFELIDRFFRDCGMPRADVVLGVGDDGALLRPPPGADLVAVSDTLVEGVHFPVGGPAESVGHRALAVNLSDIAAMGATPHIPSSLNLGSKDSFSRTLPMKTFQPLANGSLCNNMRSRLIN